MNSRDPATDSATPSAEEDTGLPRLRSWRSVYVFVVGTFGVTVALLAWFTHLFAR